MSHEMMDSVDNNDFVIGPKSRKEIYENRLNHRIIHVLLTNQNRDVLLQSRVQKTGGLAWSSTVGGHVVSGESYQDAAVRELNEEYYFEEVPKLSPLDKIKFHDPRGILKFITVYSGVVHAPPALITPEAVSVSFFSLNEIKQMLEQDRAALHPELLAILETTYNID